MTVGGVTEELHHPPTKVNMSMNLFRLAGDMSHLFSIIVLLLRLRVAKNAQGKLPIKRWWTHHDWAPTRRRDRPPLRLLA
jgi:hypothetical protein